MEALDPQKRELLEARIAGKVINTLGSFNQYLLSLYLPTLPGLARVTRALLSQTYHHLWLVVAIVRVEQLPAAAMIAIGELGREYTLEMSKVRRQHGLN